MRIVSDIVAIITLLIAVAIVAVLVSQRANTVAVIQAAASGLAELLRTVVSPVTGGSGSNQQ